jgi:hypothetical protein
MEPLGDLLRRCREARCLSLDAVARLLGHKDRVKAVRKLMWVEATGIVRDDLLVELALVLGLDWALLEEVVHALRAAEGHFAQR